MSILMQTPDALNVKASLQIIYICFGVALNRAKSWASIFDGNTKIFQKKTNKLFPLCGVFVRSLLHQRQCMYGYSFRFLNC